MIGAIIKQPKWKKIMFFDQIVNVSGQDKVIVLNYDEIENIKVDFFVQNGMKKPSRPNNEIYEYIEKIKIEKGIPTLIREAPALRMISDGNSSKEIPFHEKWIKLSWNSFFVDEGLYPYDPSYDRWSELSKKYNIEIKDWKRRGDAVLFNLQKDGDSALNRLTYNGIDYKDYCAEKIKEIKQYTDRPIIIRKHPLDNVVAPYLEKIYPEIEFSKNKNLYDDLNRSWCMITYNSTSCVESTLYGTPTITLDPSAISWSVSQHKLQDVENLHNIDRLEWCKRIAFMQWQGNELLDGYVWKLLKDLVQKNIN